MNEPVYFFKVDYVKKDEAVFIPHIYQTYIFARALRMAGVNFEYTKGFNPRPKIRFVFPLSVGVTGVNEMFFFFSENRDFNIEKMNNSLPKGLKISKISENENRKFSENDISSGIFEFLLKKTYNIDLNLKPEEVEILSEKDNCYKVRFYYKRGLKFWDMIKFFSGRDRFENVDYIKRLELECN
ncbi:TIGR03936 family radical SAM-associated protein [bacterium]|nr:TIGR03936 family radical SAM-associated protein [bacterium]